MPRELNLFELAHTLHCLLAGSAWLARLMQFKLTYQLKGLILAQNERWRRGLGMQVVREVFCLH